MVFCIHNSDIMTWINSLYAPQTSPVVLCRQNSVIRIRITSLHGSQTSPFVLCMQNNVISIKSTSLYGSQPSFVAFAYKTATLGPELQVSIGPRLQLCCFFCIQSSVFSTLFWMHKTTGEVWDPWRLVILVLITLFCMHKTTGEVWDP